MRCKSYVGLACVDGTCPVANFDEYQERCIPVVWSCDDCSRYKGCDDCALFDTDCCPERVFYGEVNGMRTSLEYSVLREEEYDYKTDKLVNRVKSRGFVFCVNGCKTKEEHEKVIDDFYEFLAENDVESYGFGGGTWEEAMRLGDEKNFSYLDIPVKDIEDKEYIKDLYKEWKQKRQ